MKLRVLHVASLKKASTNPGVLQQMEWEQSAARAMGMNWDVELWTTETAPPTSVLRQVPSGLRGFFGRRLHYHRRLRDASLHYDRIVIRHAPLDLFSLFLPNRVRRKAWYVFHTKTEDYLIAKVKWLGRPLAVLDRLFTRHAVGASAGIIGVTEELVEYERKRLGRLNNKTAVYPNGIYLVEWANKIPDRRQGALKIIFIASHFFDWNGLERLLRSVVSTHTDITWELHLVGHILPHQAAFIRDNGLADRVVIHGVLDKGAINALMASMDLSLGAFALDKINTRTACTLKVRESLSVGVPVYAGHRDVGLINVPKCYTEGNADWSAILKKAAEARGQARAEIRSASRPAIDKEPLLIKLAKDIS